MTSQIFDLSGTRVYVAGHSGMVGSALVRRLGSERCEIVAADHRTLDLTNQHALDEWLAKVRPHIVLVAAAKVGGIAANSKYPADFLTENLAIALNVIRSSHAAGVKKLLFLGSSCIYPRLAPQPMTEDMLMTGPLEPTNEGYAIAKIAAIKLIEAYRTQYGADFVSVMPTNIYGRNDNYHPEHSHVPASLIRRFHEAKIGGHPSVTIWGSGQQRREFLSADDLADACVFVLKNYSGLPFLNVGTGEDVSISDFARIVADVVDYNGELKFDTSKPDGMPRKLLDVSRLSRLGWRAKIPLRAGIADAYANYLAGLERNS